MPALKVVRSSIREPYPGLRPFDLADAFLFFGREQHTQELLDRLSRNRFLAVVGTSGSGKSSLVRAGLMPALYRGYLIGSSTHWRIAIMRPGGGPLDQLSRALAAKEALNADPAALRTRIESSSLGLTSAVREANLAPGESLLLIVDQFEELFRFASESRSTDTQGEALLFVRSLLEAVDQFEVPIYVVITMRTDFLGDCTLFPGLPEALNRSQYLIPRLSREQRRAAIENPIEIAGAEVSSRLVQRILNDVGDDPDQLPVMQHALARMYRLWKEQGADRPLDLEDYDRAGGLESALNDHAQQIYEQFDGAGREWTRKLFRCLTKMEKGREVRRPGRLDRILAVVGANDDASRAAVTKIVETYAGEENSLLFVSPGVQAGERIVDISHESLIRKWQLLSRWTKEEAESAECLADLLRDSRRQLTGEADYWREPELSRVLVRKRKDGWTAAWAEQYGVAGVSGFKAIENFLDQSLAKERRRRLKRIGTFVLYGVLVLAGLATAEFYRDSQKAQEGERRAKASEQTAKDNERKAKDSEQKAKDSEQKAEKALKDAQDQLAKELGERDKLQESVRQGTASASDQAHLNEVNTRIIQSLQEENKSLTTKLKDSSKQPVYEKQPVNDKQAVSDKQPPNDSSAKIAELNASLEKERQQRQQAEAKLQALQTSTANPTRQVAPVTDPPATPARQAPISQRLEGNSAIYVSGYDVLLIANFHEFKDLAELYVISGQSQASAAATAFNHNEKKSDQLLGSLKSVTCNGHPTSVDGHSTSCFSLESRKLSLTDGRTLLLDVQSDNRHLNIIVKGFTTPSNKDKAWLDFTVQAAM